MQTTNKLPAGYIEISDVAIPISRLEKFTTDVDRFLKYLPAATEINNHEPRSPRWIEIAESAENIKDLAATVGELGRFHTAMAEDLEAELTERRFPS